jgi:hypothetical protein
MTNLNPEDYKNGVPVGEVAVASGETVNSADPSITVGPAKAVVAAVAGALVGGLTYLSAALQDNVVSGQEWVNVALAVIIGTGVVGGATYATRTTVKGN